MSNYQMTDRDSKLFDIYMGENWDKLMTFDEFKRVHGDDYTSSYDL